MGIPLERVYGEEDVAGLDLRSGSASPGGSPTPAASIPTMYRDRPWTMREFAGFATAEETNARFRYLCGGRGGPLDRSTCPPSSAWTPTTPAAGEVGRVGVAIDSVEDMGACSTASRSTASPA